MYHENDIFFYIYIIFILFLLQCSDRSRPDIPAQKDDNVPPVDPDIGLRHYGAHDYLRLLLLRATRAGTSKGTY